MRLVPDYQDSPPTASFALERVASIHAAMLWAGSMDSCDMETKNCFKCGESKPIVEFYRHPMMADGRLGKCKTCTKTDVTRRRDSKLDEIREYDRNRGNRQTAEWRANYKATHKAECDARTAVDNAVRDGRLTRMPCEVCGGTYRIQGHHDDYSKPLDVRWLCVKHHRQHHTGRMID